VEVHEPKLGGKEKFILELYGVVASTVEPGNRGGCMPHSELVFLDKGGDQSGMGLPTK
jgi:hypothetical protein